VSFLVLNSIRHSFAEKTVLHDISLQVERGQFVCLLGPSGSGKTTLLKVIAGLIRPISGQVIIDGKDQVDIPTYRRDIGFVFQSPTALFPHLTVFENVSFPFRRGNRTNHYQSWRDAVHQILKRVELNLLADKGIAILSGGEKQRVAIARALVYQPSLFLLDEPLSSLDNILKRSLLELMQELHKELKITFIYVTHDEREALAVASHIAILDDFNLCQFGSVQEVTSKPKTPRVAEIVGGWNILHAKFEKLPTPHLCLINQLRIPISDIPPTDEGVATFGIPSNGLKIAGDTHNVVPSNFILSASIVENQPIYNGSRMSCKLSDGQLVSVHSETVHPFKPGDVVHIFFTKEDVHVFHR